MLKQQQKATSCVHCRQMKLKCDKKTRFPAPCSRCEKAGVHCFLDPAFKRTARRERLDVVERELQTIKQLLQTSTASVGSSATTDISYPPPANDDSPCISTSAATTTTTDAMSTSFILRDIRANGTKRQLGDIELEPHMVADLVEEYYTHYHDVMPILPDMNGFLEHVDESILLFWVTMVTSLTNKPDHRDLYFRLAELVETMACEVIHPRNQTFHAMQALLLLCCWPLPFGATKDDRSRTYISLATHVALRLGLHRPKHVSDFQYNSVLNTNTLISRRKTWIACFIMNQNISLQYGVPCLVQLDQSLLEALSYQPPWLPDSLFYQLHDARQTHSICNVLGNYEMTSTGLLPNPSPTMRVLEAELRQLETRFSESWGKADFIAFLGCRLLLYTFALTAKDNDKGDGSLQREILTHWLPQAYLSATTTVQTAASITDKIPFLSIHIRKCLVNSLFFLLKLAGHTEYALFADEATVQNCINEGWGILKRCSLRENDHMSRVCAVCAYLGGKTAQDHGLLKSDPFLSVKARIGANLSMDTVFRARDRFSQFIKDQRPADYTEAAAHADLGAATDPNFSDFLDPAEYASAMVDWDALWSV